MFAFTRTKRNRGSQPAGKTSSRPSHRRRLFCEPLENRCLLSGLSYSTFLGGSRTDYGQAIAVDALGNTYIAGKIEQTGPDDFPLTAGAYNGGSDGFVVKFDPAGGLVYAAHLAGFASAIAVDGSGNVYVTGSTRSSVFPTTPGAFDTTYNGGGDTFVLKLDATGSNLVYSTFLGGSQTDYWSGGGFTLYRDPQSSIALDSTGSVYLTGSTSSPDFPTTAGAFDTTYNGGRDGFVVKLDATGSALVYATFLGSSESDVYKMHDDAQSIAVDSAGSAYVTGQTLSKGFPTTAGAFDTTKNGGAYGDAFVTKLNPAGSALLYSTYLGGNNSDTAYSIAVDGDGNAYVAGVTWGGFPTTAGAFQTKFGAGGSRDAFVSKLNASGSALVYSTYLGGRGDDMGNAIAVDSSGVAYVTGRTESKNFPTTAGAFDTSYNGGGDVFVTKLNATGSGLLDSTFLGGSSTVGWGEVGLAIALDSGGRAYVTGYTRSADFPTTAGAFDTTINGSADAFVTRLNFGTAIAAATGVRQSAPTVTGRHTRAVTSIVTIPSHEDARHHAARTEAADQAIASLLGSATRRRFGPSRRLDLDAELLAEIALRV